MAGTYAMFDGVGSPLTQTFGLGVFEPITAEQMDDDRRVLSIAEARKFFTKFVRLPTHRCLNVIRERGYQAGRVFERVVSTDRVPTCDWMRRETRKSK